MARPRGVPPATYQKNLPRKVILLRVLRGPYARPWWPSVAPATPPPICTSWASPRWRRGFRPAGPSKRGGSPARPATRNPHILCCPAPPISPNCLRPTIGGDLIPTAADCVFSAIPAPNMSGRTRTTRKRRIPVRPATPAVRKKAPAPKCHDCGCRGVVCVWVATRGRRTRGRCPTWDNPLRPTSLRM